MSAITEIKRNISKMNTWNPNKMRILREYYKGEIVDMSRASFHHNKIMVNCDSTQLESLSLTIALKELYESVKF